MARTHQRSLRIEDENIFVLDALPRGTVNTFINELIRIAKNEPSILEQVILSDERFKDWKLPEQDPNEIVDKMAPIERKAPRKSALPVDKPKGPVEITQQGPITEQTDTLVPESPGIPVENELLVGAEEVDEIPGETHDAVEIPAEKARQLREQAEIEAATGEPVAPKPVEPEPPAVDGAAEFDKAIGVEAKPKPADKPVETVQKPQPAAAPKKTMSDLFPGL